MVMRIASHIAAFAAGFLFSLPSWSVALMEATSGDVRAGSSSATAAAARQDQRILPGTVVTTGANSQAVLRFDDGQAMALGSNTEFRMVEYRFAKEQPTNDRFVFDLLRGAMRSVTGLIANRTPQSYTLRTPQATIGIRGTDFMVAIENPAFVSVQSGAIDVSNAAGSVTFGPGATGMVASPAALATAIAASALPASVAASFGQLSAIPMAPSGAANATGAATGGVTPAAAAIAAGVAAIIGIIVDQPKDEPSPPSPITLPATTSTGTR
jgi:hypothetical protein